MTDIRPRWEWRSFGRRFGAAEAHLAKLTPSGVQESDEIYLLAPAGGNVKIRDALMDIKVLREVNADGLEQWTPVMKAGFPIPAAEAVRVLEALALPVPKPMRASYTQDEFIAQFAAPGAAVRVVTVHKRRVRYTVGGCMAELSDVVVNGKPTRTLAVESEDAAGVIAGGARTRPGRLHQHQLSTRHGGPDRRRAGALRRDRRRHQFDQVPRRRARRGRPHGEASSTVPR